MKEPEPIDLSPLDPMENPARWQPVVDATLERVDAALDHPSADPLTLIAGWSRPVLLAAAGVLAVLVPIEFVLERSEDRREQVERLVALSLHGDPDGGPPDGAQFLRALQEEQP